MWFFMYSCYLLTALSFVCMLLLGLQGYVQMQVLGINHPAFALLTAIIYLLTETLVMFFFVGTGVSVKEYSHENKLDPSYHQRSVSLKRRLYPPVLLNILLFMIAFITGGAVDTGKLPGFWHGMLFWFVFLHFVKTIVVQHRCFRANTAIILNMSNIPTELEMNT